MRLIAEEEEGVRKGRERGEGSKGKIGRQGRREQGPGDVMTERWAATKPSHFPTASEALLAWGRWVGGAMVACC